MDLDYDPRKQFGAHLAALRRTRGISQERLALETGFARSYVSAVERGIRNISLINICILAKTLGLQPSELMSFSLTGSDQ